MSWQDKLKDIVYESEYHKIVSELISVGSANVTGDQLIERLKSFIEQTVKEERKKAVVEYDDAVFSFPIDFFKKAPEWQVQDIQESRQSALKSLGIEEEGK